MYLKKIILENVGPIEKLEFEMPFVDKNPKPLILVGENGAGKSHLISYIFDAFFEFHKTYFRNISNKENAYFRFSGGNNTTHGKEYLLAYLAFEQDGKMIEYIDKNGTIALEDAKKQLSTTLENISKLGNFGSSYFKSTTEVGKDKTLEKDFRMNAYCYFPANRSETPHWLNSDALKDESFHMKDFLSGILEKDIILETSLQKNKKWLLDVVLDYLNSQEQIQGEENINLMLWDTVNQILRNIFSDNEIRLGIGDRNNFSRISIVRDVTEGIKSFLPSINCLSQGQAVLFNLFVSIIKLSDSNPKPLNEIIGIVLIDEIDLHLHSNLQKEVLPKLIQLFPKVQFIITTHSPLFVLGMEQTLGQDGVEIREMPTGNVIAAERFREFEKAFEYFKETKTYEENLNSKIQKSDKEYILFVEGESDKIILENAWIKLFPEEARMFDIANGFDRHFIGNTFLREDVFRGSTKTFIGLLDFDDAYENYQKVKDKIEEIEEDGQKKKIAVWEEIESTESSALTLKHKKQNGYLLLLPVPENRKSYANKEQKSKSILSIEFLFLDEKIGHYLDEKVGPMNVVIPKFKDDKKIVFSNGTSGFSQNDFANFRPLFEKIKSICNPTENPSS